jgi:hypothetical protein
MQVDIDVQETEVSWLDSGRPPLALALAGVVNVQAVSSPAISTTPASERETHARVRTNSPLFDLRLSRIPHPPLDAAL